MTIPGGGGNFGVVTAAAAYGRTIERLAQVKAACDPENTFRLNQYITPAASGPEPATMP